MRATIAIEVAAAAAAVAATGTEAGTGIAAIVTAIAMYGATDLEIRGAMDARAASTAATRRPAAPMAPHNQTAARPRNGLRHRVRTSLLAGGRRAHTAAATAMGRSRARAPSRPSVRSRLSVRSKTSARISRARPVPTAETNVENAEVEIGGAATAVGATVETALPTAATPRAPIKANSGPGRSHQDQVQAPDLMHLPARDPPEQVKAAMAAHRRPSRHPARLPWPPSARRQPPRHRAPARTINTWCGRLPRAIPRGRVPTIGNRAYGGLRALR